MIYDLIISLVLKSTVCASLREKENEEVHALSCNDKELVYLFGQVSH